MCEPVTMARMEAMMPRMMAPLARSEQLHTLAGHVNEMRQELSATTKK